MTRDRYPLHYGYERRPQYVRTVVGLVLAHDPQDAMWWRPLVVVLAPVTREVTR